MFGHPHPLVNQGAGRKKTDPENEKRIQTVLKRYREWYKKVTGEDLYYPITQQQARRAFIVFPSIGFLIGVVSSYTFVHPNSTYIGKVFTLFTSYLGFWFAQKYQNSYKFHKYFWNYPSYPKDIQKMIDNNDARYAYRWQKDNYLQIEDL